MLWKSLQIGGAQWLTWFVFWMSVFLEVELGMYSFVIKMSISCFRVCGDSKALLVFLTWIPADVLRKLYSPAVQMSVPHFRVLEIHFCLGSWLHLLASTDSEKQQAVLTQANRFLPSWIFCSQSRKAGTHFLESTGSALSRRWSQTSPSPSSSPSLGGHLTNELENRNAFSISLSSSPPARPSPRALCFFQPLK